MFDKGQNTSIYAVTGIKFSDKQNVRFLHILFSTKIRFNSFMMEVPIKVSPANQWTGFYMIGTSVMKEF